MNKICLLLAFQLGLIGLAQGQKQLYQLTEGRVAFLSEAPLERIEAASGGLKGLIDPEKAQFAFSLVINSFEGFNSPLQQVHFQENYMETDLFPKATYSGQIIERINWTEPGTYTVRTKGKFVIHGIEQERIIKSTLTIAEDHIEVRSNFTILLADHHISIPKIVNQKIAEEIQVEVSCRMEKSN